MSLGRPWRYVELGAAVLAGAWLGGCAAHSRMPEPGPGGWPAAAPDDASGAPTAQRQPRSKPAGGPAIATTAPTAAPAGSPAPDAGSAGDAEGARAGDTEPGSPAAVPGPRLPAESIRRVVRWNVGRFRGCYERAIVASPKLEGRVSVRFWIDGSGLARDPAVAQSDLPESLAACFAAAFGQLRFPAVEGGPIGVLYGFQLASHAPEKPSPEPPSEALRANRHTPSAGGNPGAEPDVASDRLFRLFLAGIEQGPSAPPLVSSPPNAAGATQVANAPTPPVAAPPPSSAPSATPSAGTRCHAGDPLCSDI